MAEFCSKCGAQLKEGAAFCANCGAPVGMAGVADGMQETEGKTKKEGKSKKKAVGIVLLVVLLCILIAAIAVGIIFFLRWKDEQNEAAMRQYEEELEEEYRAREKRKNKKNSKSEETAAAWDEVVEELPEEVESTTEDMPAVEEDYSEEPALYEIDEEGIHSYELIVRDVSWIEAYLDCLDRGGHLVRINSDEEYQAILQQIYYEGKDNIKFWLGGTRDPDTYEYRWVYEDGTYGDEILNRDAKYISYWLDGEPSFADETVGTQEMFMNMFYVSKSQRWVWNDVPNDVIEIVKSYSGTIGYICEYDY